MAPKGTPTRPATDLVRGAIMSMLENMDGDWDNVLDLFSGSGGLGIEALSRGAGWADFVDREARCCAIIKSNLERTKLTDRAHVYCCSIAKAISFLDKEYDILLIDPPYANPNIGDLLTEIDKTRLITPQTRVVVTHSPHMPLGPKYGALNLVTEHRHGDSCINVYRKENIS